MKKTNNQAGNVIEWVILGIVLIGVVALVAWRYMEADKDQNAADQASNNSQVVQQPKDAVELGDWGAEIKDPASKYGTITAAKEGETYIVSSSKLKAGDYTCEGDDKGKLGTLSRSSTDDPMLEDVKIGDMYYGFTPVSQNDCYKEAELNTLGKDFAKDLSKVLVETKN